MEAADLATRIRTMGQLLSIVQAMRTLAGARVRQAQEKFAGLERYAAATRNALSHALALLDGDPADVSVPSAKAAAGSRVVVLFSEHGFVGALDERLLAAAEERARAIGATLAGAGARGLRLCLERSIAIVDLGSMPTTAMAAASTAARLVDRLFGEIATGAVSTLDLVFARHVPPMGWAPHVARVFPPDVAAEKLSSEAAPPIHTLAGPALVAQAIEEYAFAQITWAVAEAFASESVARLVAMDTSRRHIDDELAELRRVEHETRQELVTDEILEVASGAEAFREEEP